MIRPHLIALLLAATTGFAPAQISPTNAPGIQAPSAETSSPPPSFAAHPAIATAILNFQSSDSALNGACGELETLLEADMSGATHATMVERRDIDKIMSEQELGASGLVSADTAAKVGSLTGAQVLVTGRLFAVGDQYMIVAKIISTETSRVYGVTTSMGDMGKLTQGAADLTKKIDDALDSHHDVLVLQDESHEQRLQRLRDLVGTGPLPSVSVNISEHDYSQPSIDPAAQTEIMRDLQQLGFTVLMPNAMERAKFQITGEAFSETGVHHGNLVSSRGRVELTIMRSPSKQLVWTDREARVAVDVGDRSAGKQAIEKAAQILVERMLPKLTK